MDKHSGQPLVERVHQEFKAARNNGIKLNLRFAYAYTESSVRNGESDTSVEFVLQHIMELMGNEKMVVNDKHDVLAFLDAGFIGRVGEGCASTNDLVNDPHEEDAVLMVNIKTRAIYNALLSGL
jgi:hypothetical protein